MKNNNNITDDDIKDITTIQNLNLSKNSKITDEGIKHMQLHTLYASWNYKISCVHVL